MDADSDRTTSLLTHDNPLVRWGTRAWLVVGILVLAWLLWRAADVLRIVIAPLVLAMFPSAVLMPVVDWLEGRGWPRIVGAFVVTFGFVLFLFAILALIGWQVAAQLSGVADQFQSTLDDVQSFLRDLPGLSDVTLDASALGGGGEGSGGGGGSGGSVGGQATAAAVRVLGGVATFFTQLFLGLVAVFFYLRDGDRIGAFLVRLFPPRHQEHAEAVGAHSWNTLSGYIRGQAVVAAFDGVLFAIGLWILGVPLAAALGVIVFLGAFVPVVGSIIAGAIGVGVALVSGGFVTGLIALALIVGIQQLEGNVLAPVVLGHEVELHPLAVLVAITAGAAVLGPFGAIVGVPLAAAGYHAAGYVRDEIA